MMGKTFKHKLNVKHRIGLIENPPIFMRKFWNRINFDKGEFLALRAKKRDKILKKEMEFTLVEDSSQAVP